MPSHAKAARLQPVEERSACVPCRLCSAACPTGARRLEQDAVTFDRKRCLGCGLCVVACPTGALRLVAVDTVQELDRSFSTMLVKSAPAFLATSVRVWASRLFG